MSKHPIRFILTDIEGTTTSISFVADELFPYFRNNIDLLKTMKEHPVVKEAFSETIELALKEDGKTISTADEVIETLHRWSVEDRKITPLKTLQGLLWKKGYEDGDLKGHVYADVPDKLKEWQGQGIGLGVFSSGSVVAQKLIFGYSVAGDLTPYFSAYFDTKTGGKRETETYQKIANQLKIPASEILFLSDIVEELQAADEAGYQTIQLVRPGTVKRWELTAADFSEILVK
ncbi:MAG: 2,3-diketo-5-methylthio-1-phosphopentane phosphatase [Candidatus Fluviicola riflensis]|nr:MAG: acireductone synthase [Candidatus Fluviicola riflensis]OGS76645.1 MAG: 2,3-diketo-5-methylthio-1-phosphopentane phosphatase [Candidatus Fluviicola riflensis]OGS83000.1 MAG: 2,3-diketo-5-methylthio-1-phosphopentane phosphatase [Fluviicola sp. RIFCSPHIGHO2_01_FULL_43_53]OGS88376.1 MAG: 2,3-diketo-5-methylthio-1-phosphopentane phosphatase [Fluviicola sp. RIFCSPHIGHO2_12_FULL_43_24]